VVQEQPDTLFAQMWSASVAKSTERARQKALAAEQAERAAAREAERLAAQLREVQRQAQESFDAPRETTEQEMAGFTAMAAAIVRADIKQRLAEQTRLIELATFQQEQEILRVKAALELALAREREELEVLLLLM